MTSTIVGQAALKASRDSAERQREKEKEKDKENEREAFRVAMARTVVS